MTATDTLVSPALPAQRLLLDVPPHYDLVRLVSTAQGPGPTEVLAPLVFDAKQRALQAVLYPPQASPIEVLIHQIKPDMPLLCYGIPEGPDAESLLAQLRMMLGLDEDLETFYALCDLDKGLSWVREKDAARQLRSATVFEDLVKCLLRTRLSPSRIQPLLVGLCRGLGARTNLRRAAFPTPEAMAAVRTRYYERELSAGPLAGALLALAECCANGALYPESLRRPPRPYSELITDEESFESVVGEELEWQFRIERLTSRLPGFGPRARDLLLAAVLFPLITPALLSGVAATRELLSGAAPFSEHTPDGAKSRGREGSLPRLPEKVPRGLEELVRWLLSSDPDVRLNGLLWSLGAQGMVVEWGERDRAVRARRPPAVARLCGFSARGRVARRLLIGRAS